MIRPDLPSPATKVEEDSGDGRQLGIRESTRQTRQQAVERAIETMREAVAEPLSLDDMARAAMFSPYYFHRVFRAITGVPPARFLSALRMVKACQLLLTTDMRVIDVCFEVGFQSLGTFTTRFTQQVGVPPQQLRWLAKRHATRSLSTLATPAWDAGAGAKSTAICGWIETPPGRTCITMLGLFAGESPQGPPLACAVVRSPGPFSITSIPHGRCHVFAAGFPRDVLVVDATLLDIRRLLVSIAEPIGGGPSQAARAVHVRLRSGMSVDPPIILAAPILAAQQAHPAAGGYLLRPEASGPRQTSARVVDRSAHP